MTTRPTLLGDIAFILRFFRDKPYRCDLCNAQSWDVELHKYIDHAGDEFGRLR